MSEATNGTKSALRTAVWTIVLLAAAATIYILKTTPGETAPPRVALITADSDPYWDRVAKGAQSAADEKGIDLTVMRADGTLETQTRMMLDAVKQRFDGVAISPVDANRQVIALKEIAAASRLVTVDSDSELSDRICFIGADNYASGRQCGELIKAALPDGARVAIVMGPIVKANGERRRQGIIDELLDRSYGPGRPTEPLDQIHTGNNYTIAATLIDEIDPAAAQENVRAALENDPAIDCVVGLFAYSTPAALAGIDEAGAAERITVLGFDDRKETLQAVADGRVVATLVQDQFSYGNHAVRLLAETSTPGEVAIPITRRMHFPMLTVNEENVEAVMAGRIGDDSAG